MLAIVLIWLKTFTTGASAWTLRLLEVLTLHDQISNFYLGDSQVAHTNFGNRDSKSGFIGRVISHDNSMI